MGAVCLKCTRDWSGLIITITISSQATFRPCFFLKPSELSKILLHIPTIMYHIDTCASLTQALALPRLQPHIDSDVGRCIKCMICLITYTADKAVNQRTCWEDIFYLNKHQKSSRNEHVVYHLRLRGI